MKDNSNAHPTEYWTRLANFAVLCALLFVIAAAVLATWEWYGEDFVCFHTWAKVILAGQNPYEYDRIVATMLSTTGRGGNCAFYYPLWLTFPFLPLALLPLQISRFLWLVFEVLFWAIAVLLTDRLLGGYPDRWIRWSVWLFAFFLFEWGGTLRAEQIASALFLVWALCVWALELDRTMIAAIAMALLLVKPNVTFLPFIVLCLYAWRRKKRIVLGAIMVSVSLFFISSLVTPGWWDPIIAGCLPNGLSVGLSGSEIDARRLTTTTLDFLDYNLGIQRAPAVFIQIVIGLLAVCLIWRERQHVLYDSILAVTLGFLVTPYAMQYDYALLTPAFLWVVHQFFQLNRSRQIVIVAGLAFLVSILIWEKPISDGLWLPITLTGLLLFTAPSASLDSVAFHVQFSK